MGWLLAGAWETLLVWRRVYIVSASDHTGSSYRRRAVHQQALQRRRGHLRRA